MKQEYSSELQVKRIYKLVAMRISLQYTAICPEGLYKLKSIAWQHVVRSKFEPGKSPELPHTIPPGKHIVSLYVKYEAQRKGLQLQCNEIEINTR